VGEPAFDLYDQRLFLLVADDDTLQNSLRHELVLGLRRGALLRGDGHDASDVAAYDAHARGVLQLPARLLKAQVELLLLSLSASSLS